LTDQEYLDLSGVKKARIKKKLLVTLIRIIFQHVKLCRQVN